MHNTDEKTLSHLDKNNNPTMVDVGDKQITKRKAVAQSIVTLTKQIVKQLSNNDIHTKKGPVFQTAIIAGTQGAKKTSDLIPMCHPLGLDSCKFEITLDDLNVIIKCTCTIESKTGVEMEALTGATIAALTVYDMCKALSHDIVIHDTRLLQKSGGKSDYKSNDQH